MNDGLFSDSLVTWKWKAGRRLYQQETESWACSRAEVLIDPLNVFRGKNVAAATTIKKPEIEPGSEPTTPKFADPLGATARDHKKGTVLLISDVPLVTKRREEPKLTNTLVSKEDETGTVTTTEKELPGFVPWSTKKHEILEAFSGNENSRNSFLYCVPDLKKTDLSITGRAAQRLEQLEDRSGVKKLAIESQEEHLRAINELHKNLQISWAQEKKIESINLAVEIARILLSTVSPEFYPRQFVLVTDILDEFGNLVYERLYTKANRERAEEGYCELPNNFAVDDIPERTRDTAKNWFCKIGDIRELLPRFYVETAVIGCIRFVDPDSLTVNLIRLAEMLLSLTNPLVSCYARAFLCRTAIRLTPTDRTPHWKCLNDWMNTIPLQSTPLLTPALEWIIQCVTYNAVTYDELQPLWELCANSVKRSTILLSFLVSIPLSYVCQHALNICKLVTTDDDITCRELCVFGKRLMEGDITNDETKRIILKNCWRKAARLISMQDFIDCTTVWIEFAARFFTLNELGVMLEILNKRITPEKKYETFLDELLGIVEKITRWVDDVKGLLDLHPFLALIDLFRGDQPQCAKCAIAVLSAFVRSRELASTSDFQLANQILDLCQLLHDSLNALSTDEEKQRAAYYIIRTLDRFDLETDPERTLDFYVDARAALSNLDSVIAYLVTKVCSIGYSVVRHGKISHASETFLRACIAYAFITTASLSNSATKIELYVQAGMLSLLSNSLPQADAIVRSSIEVLASAHDLKAPVYRTVCSIFLAFLVLVPDSPNRNPLYMFNAFLNAIARYSWHNESVEHAHVLLECIYYLSAIGQPELLVHIQWGDVQSNDTLYGGAREFVESIEEKCEVVMGRLEDVYKQDRNKHSVLAIEIMEAILSIGDVETLATLIAELYRDCCTNLEFRKRRNMILRKIQQHAAKNPELKWLYEQLYSFEYSAYKKTNG